MHLTGDFMAVRVPALYLFQQVHESKMTGQAAPARVALLFLQHGGKDMSKAVSDGGLVTVSEGPLVMAGQRCSLHVAGQPARFWSVLLSRKKASTECGTVLLDDFMGRC